MKSSGTYLALLKAGEHAGARASSPWADGHLACRSRSQHLHALAGKDARQPHSQDGCVPIYTKVTKYE